MVMNRKIMDWIAKPGFQPILGSMEMKPVKGIRYMTRGMRETVVYIPTGGIADMAVHMKMSTGVVRRVPGDMS